MSKPTRRRWIAAVARSVVLLSGFWLTACLSSPTLPLPPPSPEEPTVPINGTTHLQGSVPSAGLGVRVLALNLRSGLIFGQGTETRHFSFDAAAKSGDVFAIWYTVGEDSSEPVDVTVPFPDADAGNQADAGTDCAAAGCNDAGATDGSSR